MPDVNEGDAPMLGADFRARMELTGHKAEKTRRLLIESAREVFGLLGYHGASIDAIAREANVSRATIYTYYGSKRDLLIALGVESNSRLQELVDTFVGLGPSYETDAVKQWISDYFEFLDKDQGVMLFWNNAAQGDEVLRAEGIKQWDRAWTRFGECLVTTSRAPAVGLLILASLEQAWLYTNTLRAPIERQELEDAVLDLMQALRERRDGN